jgi:hypothetical protein
MTSYLVADLSHARTTPLAERATKVNRADFASVVSSDASLTQFLDSLPHILKAQDLRAIVDAIVTARHATRGKPVIVGIGGHVIKCGLAPLLIQWMERGILTTLVMNGSASIHDFEIALIGRTSEDVAAQLETGMFGMVRETADAMNEAINTGARAEIGMGQALGQKLVELHPPFLEYSVLAACARLEIPATVHIAIGGDTIHMHANADGAALGATSFTDFRILVALLENLGDGGVYLNIGSAVILPEVFLKALNLARNLSGKPITNFTTVNLDMIQHYRPLENVVKRPTATGGAGYSITGHHEIMFPLLAQLVLAEMMRRSANPE